MAFGQLSEFIFVKRAMFRCPLFSLFDTKRESMTFSMDNPASSSGESGSVKPFSGESVNKPPLMMVGFSASIRLEILLEKKKVDT